MAITRSQEKKRDQSQMQTVNEKRQMLRQMRIQERKKEQEYARIRRERQQECEREYQKTNYEQRRLETPTGPKSCEKCERMCLLWNNLCCHCSDNRSHHRKYHHYGAGKDGFMIVTETSRDKFYCQLCEK